MIKSTWKREEVSIYKKYTNLKNLTADWSIEDREYFEDSRGEYLQKVHKPDEPINDPFNQYALTS